MPLEELVEHLGLSDSHLSRNDAAVVDTENGIDVFHALRTDVCELLDLGGSVLDLLVGHVELELLDTRLDGVPACETVSDGDVASETEVFGLEDFVGGGVVEDGFGVDTGLVGERAVAAVS